MMGGQRSSHPNDGTVLFAATSWLNSTPGTGLGLSTTRTDG
jgi:hypothetical protein